MPKRSLIFITLFIAGFLFIAFDEANAQSLQEIIDRAEKGETIRLPDGTYEEPIVIDKPIQLVGSADVVFKVKSDRPAITIKANGATLEQIAVEYESGANDTPAILIQGSQNVIRSVTIETASVGILLDDAHENLLSDISITGDETFRFASADAASTFGRRIATRSNMPKSAMSKTAFTKNFAKKTCFATIPSPIRAMATI